MRLLALTVALSLAILLAPLAAEAQQPASKQYRIGMLITTSPASEIAGPEPRHPLFKAFVQRMRELGYVYGQHFVTEPRSAEGKLDRLPELAAELVRLNVDVIVTAGGDSTVAAAKKVTTTIPVVMATSGDPVAEGFVASLARPGGNITGLTIIYGPEVESKRLQLLKEAIPRISRVSFLTYSYHWKLVGHATQERVRPLGLTLLPAEVNSPEEYADAFAAMVRQRAGAVLVPAIGPHFALRRQIVELAAKSRLPAMYGYREAVEAGGLMSYGVDLVENFRHAARYVDKILKGARPADLPVEQPRKFEFVINLRTATALGLKIPQSVLIRADEVIQ